MDSDAGGTVLSRPGGEPEGVRMIERVIVYLRLAIVLCTMAAVIIGVDPMRRHPLAASVILGIALIYALLLVRHPQWEGPGTRSGKMTTLMDVALSLSTIAATGGPDSPAGTILFLAVIATATRMRLASAIGVSVAIGLCYLTIALVVDPLRNPFSERLQVGLWWVVYLLFTAVFAAAMAHYAERAYRAQAEALAEAIAEHDAAEEERDLRARLLATHEAQRDGLRALLHDFRTPVSSMTALSAELADPRTTVGPANRETAMGLIAAHAQHLSAMLDALADVEISRSPTHPAGKPRRVVLRDLLLAAGDAAGLRPPRLRLMLTASDAQVQVDAQRLRRVLTNLLHNAERQAADETVDLAADVHDGTLTVRILDRGPGMTPEQLKVATKKNVSLGEAHGGSGLGLWIVEQIVHAMRGELRLDVREGGGLIAELRIPVG